MKAAQQGEHWRAGMAKSHSLCNPFCCSSSPQPSPGAPKGSVGTSLTFRPATRQSLQVGQHFALLLIWGGAEITVQFLLSAAHRVLLLWQHRRAQTRAQVWMRTNPKMSLKLVIHSQKHLRYECCFGCHADGAFRTSRLSYPIHHRYLYWRFPTSSICLLSCQLDLSCWKAKVHE